MEQTPLSPEELLTIWEQIGLKEPTIAAAYDPPFDRSCLLKCNSLDLLLYYLDHGNFCVGQGFYFKNLCFINQKEGGDEWLTIKDDKVIDSITFEFIIKRGEFFQFMKRFE